MERRTFEDSLRDAFREAEATPSERVWTNIELELEKESGGDIRRRLAFYQLLAAAAVTLALLASGVAYFMVSERDAAIEQLVAARGGEEARNGVAGDRINDASGATGSVAADLSHPSGNLARAGADNSGTSAQTPDHAATAMNDQAIAADERLASAAALNARPSTQSSVSSNAEGNSTRYSINAKRSPAATFATVPGVSIPSKEEATEKYAAANAEGNGILYGNDVYSHARSLPAFYAPVVHVPSMKPDAPDPVALMMSKLAEQEMQFASNETKKDKAAREKIWTSLGVAAGGFNAVTHSAAPAQANNMSLAFANTTVPDKQAKASGVSYSAGVSFGTQVARRWVLQGGVNYLTQSSNYTATNVIAGPNYQSLQAESINALGKIPALADAKSAGQLAPTVPYSVNNNLKFFSVPMQAGYLIVNRKFGVQLNAGLSTDLFLENTITPEGGSLDKSTQSSGSDSPYRTVNFSGLMGTEFTYRLGQRYRIALNPALRYPFNSVYKSDVGIESMPLTFDVGLRFRYIFK